MLRVPAFALVLAAAPAMSGCFDGPFDRFSIDAARPPAVDLARRPVDLAPGRSDAGARDAGGADLLRCAGGYLNSSAPGACPLGCAAAVEPVADEGAAHVPFGTAVVYRHDPPASGPHWPDPAPWGIRDASQTVPREWWVHNLEHGGIVLLYNCGATGGCLEVVAGFRDLYNRQPVDSLGVKRILGVGDPRLPGRVAAVAWRWAYVSDTFDFDAFACFIDARYGRGPENAP